MPLKLIAAILAVGLLVTFIGLNLENSCDISLGFWTLKSIPVFLTILASFAAGLLAALPAVFIARLKGGRSRSESKAPRKGSRTAALSAEIPASNKRSSRNRRAGNSELEDGSYGVD